jgi:hypothetical protein
MDKDLKELIDEAMKPLERFRVARKRIVSAVLAEAANELLNDRYYDVLAHRIIRDLEDEEKLRRGRESLAMRKVVDLIFRLPSAEDSSFLQYGSDEVETKPGSVTDLSQHYHNDNGQM